MRFGLPISYVVLVATLAICGCAGIPDRQCETLYHNPFPQLSRVAIVPFFNQSSDPTLSGEEVALAYYNELQLIPGFEVVPIGVVKQAMQAYQIEARDSREMRRLAQLLKVDVVIVGAITDFDSYYPPRIGLAVDWYAANPGFHPIPAGYGLPWGTDAEKNIPPEIVHQAEFALAREQLNTQTPDFNPEPIVVPPQPGAPPAELVPPPAPKPAAPAGEVKGNDGAVAPASAHGPALPNHPHLPATKKHSAPVAMPGMPAAGAAVGPDGAPLPAPSAPLPLDWPDPRGFIPRPPCVTRPQSLPQHEPVISHVKLYNGHDSSFTEKLEDYYEFRDEARFGGWQAYLQRKQDFIRFCCHLHVTETLAARGGATEKHVVWRWPFGRYER